MKSTLSTFFALLAAAPLASADKLNFGTLTVTVVTDYPDSVFDPPEVPDDQWSTDAANSQVLVDHMLMTKVYDLIFDSVDDRHFIEFDVRREVWGIGYEHHCKVSVVQDPLIGRVHIKLTGLDDFSVGDYAEAIKLDCPKVPTSMGER